MRILKYVLFGVGGLIVIAGAGIAYIAATFDPNQYKPQIIHLVKEKYRRTLRLEGNIKLSFWPGLGADLGRFSLSEPGSDKQFAAVENARASLALLPLLGGKAVVDTVAVRGLRANIVRGKDGRMNIDDLIGKGGGGEQHGQVAFDIAGVTIEDAAVTYRDEGKGAQYALSRLNLKTGRITPGVPSTVALSFNVQGNQPKINLRQEVKGRLTFDLFRQAFAFENFTSETHGEAAGYTNLSAKASGDVRIGLKSGEFTASGLAANVSATSGKENLELKLDVPKLIFAGDKASGDKLAIVAKITRPQGAINASLDLPGIEGTAQAFRSKAMTLDLDVKQGPQAIKAKITSPLTGDFAARRVSLPQLKANLSVAGPGLPGPGVSGDLAGSAAVDGAKENAQINLTGKLADSNIKTRVAVSGFSPPGINFDLDIDKLDLDRYMPAPASGGDKGGGKGAGDKSGGAKKEEPFDLSGLRNLRANGSVRIGALTADRIKAINVRLDIKAAGGRLDVNPLSANLYQGTLHGALVVNAAAATPQFSVKQNLAGVSVGPLLKDLANNDTLEGRGNVTADVTAQGNTVTTLKKTLGGTAAVNLTDGALKGINIAESIRNAKAKLGALKGGQAQPANKTEKTDFSELKATFQIRNGVAHNNDLSMKSPLLRVGGEGDVNIGADNLDYLVKATVVATTKGQGGGDLASLRGITVPVRVTGPLAAPSYKLDFGAVATEAVKQKAEEAVKGKVEDRLKGGLKGLFGR